MWKLRSDAIGYSFLTVLGRLLYLPLSGAMIERVILLVIDILNTFISVHILGAVVIVCSRNVIADMNRGAAHISHVLSATHGNVTRRRSSPMGI